MKKVLFLGMLVATALCGCHKGNNGQGEKPIGNSFLKRTLVYKNSIAVAVRFEAYDGNSLKGSVTIEPGKSLEQVERIGAGSNGEGAMVNDYKTVRVVFGDTKELMFTNSEPDVPYNIFKRANYKTITLSEQEEKCDYEVSETMMNIAIAIKTASAEKLLPTMIESGICLIP